MEVLDLPLDQIDISKHNVRKNLTDGETDGGIADLAHAIESQGLLNPIIVARKGDGRYSLIAGQRRYLAMRVLGRLSIEAVVRGDMSDSEATAVSLVENVHRADMNPRDKAVAFKTLLDRHGSLQGVHKATGVTVATIKKYVQLLDLAPELHERLAAGETRATDALARLAQTVQDADEQVEVYDKIGGFTQDVQQQILRQVNPDLGNLDDLVERAHEGAFDVTIIRNCPWDCRNVPGALKQQVADLIKAYGGGSRQN
jgi:ParB family chromosome partitioning protein